MLGRRQLPHQKRSKRRSCSLSRVVYPPARFFLRTEVNLTNPITRLNLQGYGAYPIDLYHANPISDDYDYSDDDDFLPTIHKNDTATCNSNDDRVDIWSQFVCSFILSLSLHSTRELYHNILYECMIACIVYIGQVLSHLSTCTCSEMIWMTMSTILDIESCS